MVNKFFWTVRLKFKNVLTMNALFELSFYKLQGYTLEGHQSITGCFYFMWIHFYSRRKSLICISSCNQLNEAVCCRKNSFVIIWFLPFSVSSVLCKPETLTYLKQVGDGCKLFYLIKSVELIKCHLIWVLLLFLPTTSDLVLVCFSMSFFFPSL